MSLVGSFRAMSRRFNLTERAVGQTGAHSASVASGSRPRQPPIRHSCIGDGDILDGDLRLVSTEEVTGNVLAGMTMTFTTNHSRSDGRVGCGGIWQNDLNVFGGQSLLGNLLSFTVCFGKW